MFPGSAGSGAEPAYPMQGFAHPYLDPSAAARGAGPTTFNAYAGRPAPFSSEGDARAASTESSPTESDAFTKEDRVLLRLLYHQQQAIQVQLNTMTEWVQQVNYRLAALERQARHQPRPAPSTSPATASPAAPPPSRSASTAEAAPASAASPRPIAGAAPPSVYSSQGLAAHAHAASSVPAMSSVLENSRACTPPSEQSRPSRGGAVGGGSAVPSTSRSLESALAPPWDPHSASLQSASGAGPHSRTSSHASALGRRANPLLGSSSTVSKLPTASATGAAAGARPSWGDPRPLARPDGGTTQTSFSSGFASFDTQQPASQAPQHRQPPIVSPPTAAAGPYGTSPAYTAADAFVPPYRRLPPEATARQPLSRTAASLTTSTAASTAARAVPTAAGAADAAQSRRGREGTLPPAPSSGASAGSAPEATSGGARESRPTQSTAVASAYRDPTTAADPHSASRESQEGQRRRITPNDDSLSDGYGSYESRMYMRSLGLL